MMPIHPFRITAVESLGADLARVSCLPERESLQHQAGQYTHIQIESGEARPFSIANAPSEDGRIELHIRTLRDVDYAQVLADKLVVGERLDLTDAEGHCTWQRLDRPTLFIAGGTGFAPCRALLEAAYQSATPPPLHLYWAMRSRDDFYEADLLAAWEARGLLVRRLTLDDALVQEVIPDEVPSLSEYQVYAFGPFEMVYQCRDALVAKGVAQTAVFGDAFGYAG